MNERLSASQATDQYSEPIMLTKPSVSAAGPLWAWLPSQCHVCGIWPAKPWGQAVCGDCLSALVPKTSRCSTCALALGTGLTRCSECVLRPPVLARCVAAVEYAYPWDHLVARFKFHGDTAWAQLFASLMADAPGGLDLLNRCDAVVPLPLTPQRLGERGYNQAWLLVQALCRRSPTLRDKPRSNWLVKLRDTPPQHELNRTDRLTNLRTVFAVPPQALQAVTGQRVLLIDDIMTTGATLQAAAQALTMAGVSEVIALVFARTPHA